MVIVLRIGKKMSGTVHNIASRKAVRMPVMYGSPGATSAYEFHRSPSTWLLHRQQEADVSRLRRPTSADLAAQRGCKLPDGCGWVDGAPR